MKSRKKTIKEEKAKPKDSEEQINKKKNVLMSFDEDMLIEVKRILFKKNIFPQQLISYLFHKINLNDETAMKIVAGAEEFYRKELEETLIASDIKILQGARKNKVINNDILYDIIERGTLHEKRRE